MWSELSTFSFVICTFHIVLKAGAAQPLPVPTLSPTCVGSWSAVWPCPGDSVPVMGAGGAWASLLPDVLAPLGPLLFNMNFRKT